MRPLAARSLDSRGIQLSHIHLLFPAASGGDLLFAPLARCWQHDAALISDLRWNDLLRLVEPMVRAADARHDDPGLQPGTDDRQCWGKPATKANGGDSLRGLQFERAGVFQIHRLCDWQRTEHRGVAALGHAGGAGVLYQNHPSSRHLLLCIPEPKLLH